MADIAADEFEAMRAVEEGQSFYENERCAKR